MKLRRNSFLACSIISLSLLQFAQAATGIWSGGTGDIWDTTATNWTGVTDTPWDSSNGPGNSAVFNLAALLAPVSGTVFTNGITFNTTGTINAGGIITLDGTSPVLSAASGVTGTLKSNLAGSVGFSKTGVGTITINNATANSLTGDIIVNAGQLTIQPSANVAAIATLANLAMNGSNLALLGGGTTGAATTRSQTFTGTTFGAGHSAASVNKNSGDATNPATLDFGNVTRSVGATASLSYTGNTTADRSIKGTATGWGSGTTINDSDVVYATTNSTVVTSTAVTPRSSNDWAAYSGTAVLPATYTDSTASALAGNANVALGIDTTLAANTSITSLRFAQAQARTITATGFNLTTGGILVASTIGNFTQIITGGTLSSAATVANKDLVVIQNNTGNDLLIASQIVNATAGATGLTKSGAGRLALTSATNNYTGETRINEGTLRIGAGGSTGQLSASSAIINNGSLGFDRTIGMTQGTHFSSNISGIGSVSVLRATAVTLNSANTFSGGVTIPDNGVLRISHAAALGTGTLTIGNGNGTADHVARFELTNNISVANAITLNGRVTSTSDGIRNVSGNNTLAGTITMYPGGGTGYIQSDADLLTLGTAGATAVTPSSTVPSGRTLVLRGAGNGLVAGNLVNHNATKTLTLIKDGTGTWTLSGNNTYSGNTTVLDGTLVIANDDVLDDNSTVSLASASSLNLTHSGIDRVGTLIIGGATQPDGKYTFGTGQIQVGPDGTPFSIWAAGKITAIDSGADASAGGDPDNDGVSNLEEFAFSGDPLNGSSEGQIHLLKADSDADSDSSPELILTLAVRKNAPAFTGSPSPAATVDGITCAIQGSANLADGFAAPVSPVALVDPGVPLTDSVSYEYRSFVLDGSNGLPSKGFLRASVTETP